MSLTKLLKKNPPELAQMSDKEKVDLFKSATQERNMSFRFLQGYQPYKAILVGMAIGVGVSLISSNSNSN
jgi:hypothetical protein